MIKLPRDLFISSTALKSAAASNMVAASRNRATALLNRLNNVDSPEQLAPSDRQQCGTRIGASMVVYSC